MEESIMTDTALRAGAQSASNTHMIFANEEHEKFYYEKPGQAGYQDCYHKALIYIPGISDDTRNHSSQIYDIETGNVKPECLVLVYKHRQEKLNNLYYQMKKQKRCSIWLKTKNLTLRNSGNRP